VLEGSTELEAVVATTGLRLERSTLLGPVDVLERIGSAVVAAMVKSCETENLESSILLTVARPSPVVDESDRGSEVVDMAIVDVVLVENTEVDAGVLKPLLDSCEVAVPVICPDRPITPVAVDKLVE